MSRPRRLSAALGLTLGWLATEAALGVAACPGCIEGSTVSVQSGFQWSILFMMAVPYLAVGLIGGGLVYAHRRAVREQVEDFIRAQTEESS